MPDGIASRLGTAINPVSYSSSDERLLDTVLAMPSAATRSRAGVRPGGGLEVTMSTGPDAANIAPGGGVINDTGAGAGSYVFVIPASVAINLATRPGVGTSRFDKVVAVIKNVDARPADGTNEVDLQVITGTAGASPTAPATPSGALLLAQLTVPSTGTISVTNPPPRIAALGGILPVASQTVRDAISPIYDSLVVYREDTDVFEARLNGAWVTMITGPTAWTTLTLTSPYTAKSGYYVPAWRIWPNGDIDMRGAADKGSAMVSNETVLTLPAGAIPASDVARAVALSRSTGAAAGRVDIDSGTGTLKVQVDSLGTPGTWLDLGGIRYTKS